VVCVVDEYGGVCEDVVGSVPCVFVEEFEDVGRAGDPSIPGVGVVVVDLEFYRTGCRIVTMSTGPLPNGAGNIPVKVATS
jgi:hypothetical protein